MSRKLSALIVGAVASLALVAGAMQGCGSSSSSGNNYTALCQQGCEKSVACADAGAAGADALAACKSACMSSQTGTTTCSNASAIASAYQACLNMADCTAYMDCLGTIPPCQMTSGTGGAGGSTGTGGGGGSSGAGCANCTKFDSCCIALGGTTASCTLGTMCTAAAASSQASYNSACATALTQAAMDPSAPAACR